MRITFAVESFGRIDKSSSDIVTQLAKSMVDGVGIGNLRKKEGLNDCPRHLIFVPIQQMDFPFQA